MLTLADGTDFPDAFKYGLGALALFIVYVLTGVSKIRRESDTDAFARMNTLLTEQTKNLTECDSQKDVLVERLTAERILRGAAEAELKTLRIELDRLKAKPT